MSIRDDVRSQTEQPAGHEIPTVKTEKDFDRFNFSIKRKSAKALSAKCLFNAIPSLTQDSPVSSVPAHPVLAELASTLAREIEIHENWVNACQRAKTPLVDKIYHLFEKQIREFFKPGVKVL